MSEEIANNNHIDDFIISNGTVIPDFTGKILEMKYFLKSSSNIASFLQSRVPVQTRINSLRINLKFQKIICRFYFGKYEPNINEQKKLVDFQKGIFDEVTIQMIKDKFDEFKIVLDYAVNTSEQDISTLVDLGLRIPLLMQVNIHIISVRPANTRWIYRKIDTYVDRYRLVSNDMQEAGLKCYLIGCRKRCSIENYKDVAVSIIVRALFGFEACCQDYFLPKKTGGYSPYMDLFDIPSYEWKKVRNNNYQIQRLQNYVNLDGASISQQTIAQITRVNQLLRYLRNL